MTDNEIKKALEWCVTKFKKAGFVYMGVDGTKLVSTQKVLDLINRLQADVENYKQIAEHQQSVTMDRGFEIKRLKEKIESLQAENERLREKVKRWKENYESSQVVVGDFRGIINEKCEELKTAKAEAYKEFANGATSMCYEEFGTELEIAHTFAAIVSKTYEILRGEN